MKLELFPSLILQPTIIIQGLLKCTNLTLYSTGFFHVRGLWVTTSQELFSDSMVAVILHKHRLTKEQAGLQLHSPTKNSDRPRLRVCCRGARYTGVCIWIKLRSPSCCPGANTPLVPVVWSSKACRLAAMMSAFWAKLGSPCNGVQRKQNKNIKQWAPSPSNSTEWNSLIFPKEVWTLIRPDQKPVCRSRRSGEKLKYIKPSTFKCTEGQ